MAGPEVQICTNSEAKLLTAHHEAGHAVVDVWRGHQLLEVSIDDDPASGHVGHVLSRLRHDVDRPFSAFAGPWAEARFQWGALAPDDLDPDGRDADGSDFDDYLSTAFMFGGGDDDWAVLGECRAAAAWLTDEMELARETLWRAELEFVWPVIAKVAAWLLANITVTTEMVIDALAGLEAST